MAFLANPELLIQEHKPPIPVIRNLLRSRGERLRDARDGLVRVGRSEGRGDFLLDLQRQLVLLVTSGDRGLVVLGFDLLRKLFPSHRVEERRRATALALGQHVPIGAAPAPRGHHGAESDLVHAWLAGDLFELERPNLRRCCGRFLTRRRRSRRCAGEALVGRDAW